MTEEEKLEFQKQRRKNIEATKNFKRIQKETEKLKFKQLSKADKAKITKERNDKKLKEKKEKDEAYTKMSREEKLRMDNINELNIRKTQDELPYLEDLTEIQLN